LGIPCKAVVEEEDDDDDDEEEEDLVVVGDGTVNWLLDDFPRGAPFPGTTTTNADAPGAAGKAARR